MGEATTSGAAGVRTVQVHTGAGAVTGLLRDGIADFTGVRYGDRVSAELFAEIGAPRSAQSAPAVFPQQPGGLDWLLGDALQELPQSDDAFVVRVQAPAVCFDPTAADSQAAAQLRPGAAGLPVLVFIPGGGFLSGGAHARWFENSPLITEGPIVLVTVNYRIGALGHLGDTGEPAEANRGLRDLKQAVTWIHANIAAFGGDPEQITLAGDSAGAWYTLALSQASELSGKFARTLLVSLPYEAPLNAAAYAARREVFTAALGGTADGGTTPLSAHTAPEMLGAQRATAKEFQGKGMTLMPAVNGEEVPADSANIAMQAVRVHTDAVALLSTSEEAAAFLRPAPPAAFSHPGVDGYIAAHFDDAPTVLSWLSTKRPDASAQDRMIDAMSLFQFRTTALDLATALSRQGVPAWVAQLSAQSPLPGAFSPHCYALPFLFGNQQAWHDAPMLAGVPAAEFETLSAIFREWILAFVRGGAPRVANSPQAPFDAHAPTGLEIDAQGARIAPPREWGIVARRR